ncbi:hypothetical protein [Streptacidiphilus melanogenes]|uniref:hypothetical protein n=1 Tax=Streptacidiphilus melanogenes TaxID=411235 RepID=UPI0005AA2C11|nr:hypothetical protein [Streptacidiphilus melanogenes]
MDAAGYELKAEYEWRTVLLWHIVPTAASVALCGRWLAPAAEVRPIDDVEAIAADDVCVRCFVAWCGGEPDGLITQRWPRQTGGF